MFSKRQLVVRIALFGLLLTIPGQYSGFAAEKEWNPGGDGITVSDAATDQFYPQIVSDGSDGTIIMWQDRRDGTGDDIYAQRFDADGNPLWAPADGVVVVDDIGTANGNRHLRIAADGTGGAVAIWLDFRGATFDIYAQKINSNGVTQWTEDGVAVCTLGGNQANPEIVPDGSGGAIMAWQDGRTSNNEDIYAQRIDSGGTVQWAANGIPISVAANRQQNPQMTSDGSGGAYITWEDNRTSPRPVYAQRVNGAGTIQWAVDGILVSNVSSRQGFPKIASDGTAAPNGAIIAWEDERNGSRDVYAQRLNSTGAAQWDAGGVAVAVAPEIQHDINVVPDNNNGAILVWGDRRDTTYFGIYAQKLNSGGVSQWTANGVLLTNPAVSEYRPVATADGQGGAIVTWINFNSPSHVYAEHISSAGQCQWGDHGTGQYGMLISDEADSDSPKLAGDTNGGAVITWYDDRNTADYGVFAEYVTNSPPDAPNIDNLNLGNWTNDSTPTLQFDLTDPDYGDIIHYQLQIDNDSNYSSPIVDVTEGVGAAGDRDDVQYTPAALGDGELYWRVRTFDSYGAQSGWANANPGATAFGVDTIDPTDPSNLSSNSHALSTWTADNTIELDWTVGTDAGGSGVDGYSYEWDTAAVATPDATKDIEGNITNITSPSLADGNSHYAHVRTLDNAGNWTSTEHYGPFFVDTTEPEGSVVINDGASTTLSQTVSLAISATDDGAGADEMIISEDSGFVGAEWEPYATSSAFTLSSGSGEKTIYIRFRDAVGNISSTYNASIYYELADDPGLGMDLWLVVIVMLLVVWVFAQYKLISPKFRFMLPRR